MVTDTATETFANAILDLANRVETLIQLQASRHDSRILIALAGVPGSGKSTLSQALLAELASRQIDHVSVVPMDGFHYTKKVLATFPDAELATRRRGAPFTFDAASFIQLVRAIKEMPITASEKDEQFLYAPSFDHAIQDPVPISIPISSRNRLIIVEGNYTLLKQNPWDDIADIWHEKWFVDAPAEEVQKRLVQRHLMAGIETSAIAAAERVAENDLPNGELIRSLLIKPDVVVVN